MEENGAQHGSTRQTNPIQHPGIRAVPKYEALQGRRDGWKDSARRCQWQQQKRFQAENIWKWLTAVSIQCVECILCCEICEGSTFPQNVTNKFASLRYSQLLDPRDVPIKFA